YIRSGEVYKPLEVVAQSSLKNDKERASLRKALEEIIDQSDETLLPESGEMKSSQTILKNNNNKSRTILMAYTIGDEKSGFNSLLTIELNNSSSNKSEFKIMNGVELFLDAIPGDTNPANLPYELQDMQFYSSQILLLIVSRRSKHNKVSSIRSSPKINVNSIKIDETLLNRELSSLTSTSSDLMHSWLVMVPIRDVLNSVENNNGESLKQTNTIASVVNESIHTNLQRKNLSEFITRGNIEALPWHAIKLTTNGDRSIVFVVRFVFFFSIIQ
ncbi:unnamed protein product, partial [Schistosoma mattheei]